MDHHRGKMSRQYECQHCGATFSKRSLLDEHKRILGHQEVFRCRVCDKGFYRKSNLESHERKHSSSEFYQCDKCKKVFSHPDRLSLHKENFHNQSGGGVKRKSTQDGLPIKRKVTKYDDPSDSYTISVVGTQKMPKFNTTSTRYKVAFRELDVRGIPNILKSLRVLFNSIIKDITKFMEPDDLVRLSVQCPELDFPISLPFMKLSQLNAERFLTEIERVLQSYEQFVMDETLEIEFIQVSMPVGGIGKRCRYVDGFF
ncbi:KRAB [Mytilus edulis]|uniref:KRAB n=1 Tax=Mytilus edulis TaxID=6550 RepID=A0A8S3QLS2_MYTED|nr:KRAB [Mytilus edulis]